MCTKARSTLYTASHLVTGILAIVATTIACNGLIIP